MKPKPLAFVVPMNTLFFKHDLWARNDPKLLRLRMRHGMEGIGVYWCLVEMMYEQGGSLAMSDLASIAYDLRISEDIIKEIISIGLFEQNGESIISSRVSEVVEGISKLSESRRRASRARWDKQSDESDDANAVQVECKCNASAMQNDADIDIEEDIDKKENKTPITPSVASVDINDLKSLFNSILAEYGSIIAPLRTISGLRKTHTLARIREHGKDTFEQMMRKAAQSDFLNGKSDRGWIATYDWLIKPNNFIKVIEGNYDNRPSNGIRNNPTRNTGGDQAGFAESDFPSSL